MNKRNHRDSFFSVLSGKKTARMPFIPDITDWYAARRTPPGTPAVSGPGDFVPDDSPIHLYAGDMPKKYIDWTLMDFYRNFDWGCHFHLGSWYKCNFTGGVESNTEITENCRHRTLKTPQGQLRHTDMLSSNGWSPQEHFVKDLKDLDILQYVIENTHFETDYTYIQNIRDQIGIQGQGDVVIKRSPFGKLVHEYMGFESVIFAMHDTPEKIVDFMQIQEKKDLELIELASNAPEELIIMSDHTDEILISPDQWIKHCVPFYKKMTDILHKKGKYVSTHLDGNIKGYFPYLHLPGFDLLDGCTPAPMFNYELEELADAMPENQYCFIGIPASLFCQNIPTKELLKFADRILKVFQGRAIINIGDILPPNGNIEQVITLGEHVK